MFLDGLDALDQKIVRFITPACPIPISGKASAFPALP